MEFRKDINGLRALAVIAVVLFHFNSSWMPGGFVGVDVFFVISGFLMTGIIFRGLKDDGFSLLKFYKSRAKRILPALSVACVFSVIYGFFFLYDTEFKDTIKQAISATTFLSNLYFWQTTNYFSPSSETKILLHTWSLSTEWQFYIIYPLVLLISSKIFGIKMLQRTILIGFILSLLISIYASPKWVTTSYYLLPTRGWEMLLGGLAYFSRFKLNKRHLNLLSSVGLILIVASCFIISKDNAWPGYLALFPAFGAFAVLIGYSDFFILKHKIAQLIGTYSYSIYLWHWVVVFMAYRYSDMNLIIIISGICVSFALGLFSFEIVEKKGFNRINKLFIASSFILPVVLLYSFETITNVRHISNTENNKLVEYYEAQNPKLNPWEYNLCEKGDECSQGGVFLWGDSHARALYYGLKSANLTNFSALTTSSCAPSIIYPEYKRSFRIKCNKNNKTALKQIKLKKPDVVVLTRRFMHENTDWNLIALKLKELGVAKVIVVGPVPQFKGSLPLLVAKKYMHADVIKPIDMDSSIFSSNEKMNKLNSESYLYIDVIKALCSKEGCLFKSEKKDNKKLISFDYGHLNANGSLYIVNKLILDKL